MCILALNAYQAFNMISGVRKPAGGNKKRPPAGLDPVKTESGPVDGLSCNVSG